MCKHAQGKVPRNGTGGGAKGGELTTSWKFLQVYQQAKLA